VSITLRARVRQSKHSASPLKPKDTTSCLNLFGFEFLSFQKIKVLKSQHLSKKLKSITSAWQFLHRFQKKPEVAPKRGLIALAVNIQSNMANEENLGESPF